MTKTSVKVAGILASGALVISSVPATQMALADESDSQTASTLTEVRQQEEPSTLTQQNAAEVKGTFLWTQGVVDTTVDLANNVYKAANHLCDSQDPVEGCTGEGSNAITSVRVSGNIPQEFVANIEEYEQKAPVRKVMGCTCAGNPVDGRASANAETGGFALAALLNDAQMDDNVNTITFTSQDGYRVALPLSYVRQRYSIIVTELNGESMQDVASCSNQLWLGSTSARSFVRNVVAIELTAEENPPAAPGAQGVAPNISITNADTVA